MSMSIWRNASRTPTLFMIPCFAYLSVFIWLYHMCWLTFWTALAVIVFYGILAKFGLTFTVLWGKFLHLMRGKRVTARPWWYRKRFWDL